MTADDLKKRFAVPEEALELYKRICTRKSRRTPEDGTSRCVEYDDQDLEQIVEMITLQEIGFDPQKIKDYLRLEEEGPQTISTRSAMLEEQRSRLLEAIHREETALHAKETLLREKTVEIRKKEAEIRKKEKILDELDHLRYSWRVDRAARR